MAARGVGRGGRLAAAMTPPAASSSSVSTITSMDGPAGVMILHLWACLYLKKREIEEVRCMAGFNLFRAARNG